MHENLGADSTTAPKGKTLMNHTYVRLIGPDGRVIVISFDQTGMCTYCYFIQCALASADKDSFAGLTFTPNMLVKTSQVKDREGHEREV